MSKAPKTARGSNVLAIVPPSALRQPLGGSAYKVVGDLPAVMPLPQVSSPPRVLSVPDSGKDGAP